MMVTETGAKGVGLLLPVEGFLSNHGPWVCVFLSPFLPWWRCRFGKCFRSVLQQKLHLLRDQRPSLPFWPPIVPAHLLGLLAELPVPSRVLGVEGPRSLPPSQTKGLESSLLADRSANVQSLGAARLCQESKSARIETKCVYCKGLKDYQHYRPTIRM